MIGEAYRCGSCNETPFWRIERRGDAAVSWSCTKHLHDVCADMQRMHEITKLIVSVASLLETIKEESR